MASLVADVVRGGLGASDLEQMNAQMNAPAGDVPPPPVPALKKGERCFRAPVGHKLLIKEVKDREVAGVVIPGERIWCEFRRHVSGQCYELIVNETTERGKIIVERLLELIAERGPNYAWEAADQVEQYRDLEAERIAARLADPTMRERVAALGAMRDSFALDAPELPKKKGEPKKEQKTEPEPNEPAKVPEK